MILLEVGLESSTLWTALLVIQLDFPEEVLSFFFFFFVSDVDSYCSVHGSFLEVDSCCSLLGDLYGWFSPY